MKKIKDKKATLSFAIASLTLISLTILSSEITDAATTKTATSTATFELTENKNGMDLDATNIIFESQETFETGELTTLQSNTSTININDFTGNAPGWKLNVSMTDFIGKKPNNKLNGASLTIPKTAIKPISEFDSTLAPTIKPVMEEVVIGPTLGIKKLMSADEGKGYGEWQAEFKKLPNGQTGEQRPMALTFRSGNLVDEYESTLTFSLVSSPTP